MLQHWRPNASALETQCRSIERNKKTGSSFNAAALMPQHWEKFTIGKMVNAVALRTQCRSMRGLVERLKIQCHRIEQWVPRHWYLKLKKIKSLIFIRCLMYVVFLRKLY